MGKETWQQNVPECSRRKLDASAAPPRILQQHTSAAHPPPPQQPTHTATWAFRVYGLQDLVRTNPGMRSSMLPMIRGPPKGTAYISHPKSEETSGLKFYD